MLDEKQVKSIHKRITNRNKSKPEYPICSVCKKPVTEDDLPECKYIETKRKDKIFIHGKCISKLWSDK